LKKKNKKPGHNNAYSLWRVNGYQQGFRSVVSFSFGGRESASKPPQAICKPLGDIFLKNLFIKCFWWALKNKEFDFFKFLRGMIMCFLHSVPKTFYFKIEKITKLI
jgi:hypothetical protein